MKRKEENQNLRQQITKIIEPLRLHCEFILRRGSRVGKKCGKRAKKTSINGIGETRSNLCCRHRNMLKKEYIADIVAIES